MPQPTASTTLQRPDLGEEIYEIDPEKQGFIGRQIFPVFETAKKAANFSKVTTESLLKEVETDRAPGAGYNRTGWEFESDNYSCEEDGLEQPIPDEDVELYSDYFDVEAANAKIANHHLLLEYEKRAAAAAFNTTTFSGKTTAVGVEWDTVASAKIVSNVTDAKEAVRQRIGVPANALAVSRKVFNKMRRNADMLSYIKYNVKTGGIMSVDDIRAALELEYLFVGGAVKDSTLEGIATTIADVWDDEYALVFYRPSDEELADIKTPCVGRTFLWTGDSPNFSTVETYREEQTRSDIVRVRHNTVIKTIMSECGQLLSNIHT